MESSPKYKIFYALKLETTEKFIRILEINSPMCIYCPTITKMNQSGYRYQYDEFHRQYSKWQKTHRN